VIRYWFMLILTCNSFFLVHGEELGLRAIAETGTVEKNVAHADWRHVDTSRLVLHNKQTQIIDRTSLNSYVLLLLDVRELNRTSERNIVLPILSVCPMPV